MLEINRLEKNSRRSRAVVHGNTVYLGGQVGTDLDGDIKTQTQQALEQVDRLLTAAGSERKKVLSVTIWLKTMDDYEDMNAVWDEWIDGDEPPARCCGKVDMADPRIRFEITVAAAI
ncbi:RidA family protein [Paraburkholderia domus]|uniref:RidA family protein n=1 Tax=Paraburkholderia domus TaxID=2793075 RepID=UPI0019147878|nr:RidA family protein [Paraburkholderia domus]MBK5065907.1 RidA family protein [Burkholderia sp. R-70199]CAE6959314.1 Putative aminoacrylate peracid reductase RutC [Paraburkholderia domus]